MGSQSNVTIRRRKLGTALRRLREEAGLTGEEVARELFWSTSKVSRLETGDRGAARRDIEELLDFYDLRDEARRAEILDLTQRPTERSWWEEYKRDGFSDIDYIELEDAAVSVRNFEIQCIPGLFQTAEYARAMFQGWAKPLSSRLMDRAVALRLGRQRLLTNGELEVRVVVDETGLRRVVGGGEVMRGQLDQLETMAALPNVSLQVFPFSAGAPPELTYPFALLRFDDAIPDTLYREGRGGDEFTTHPASVQLGADVFESLAQRALSPDRTAALIERVRADLP